ncbi:serine/threonine-protein phosphatase 6 regulatory ankyrin repeat subunit A-like, partial [Scleropages formosus]
ESGLNVLMIAVKENRISVVVKLLDLGLNPNEQTTFPVAKQLQQCMEVRIGPYRSAALTEDSWSENIGSSLMTLMIFTIMRLVIMHQHGEKTGGMDATEIPDTYEGMRSPLPLGWATSDRLLKAWNRLAVCLEQQAAVSFHASEIPQVLQLVPGSGPETRREFSWDGRTALHVAAAHSKEDIVKLLVKKVDPNIQGGEKNQLPLHYAASQATGAINVVQTLLKCSKKEARLVQDKDGYLPLFLAIEAGNMGTVKELLGALTEAQLTARRKENGDSALHISCRRRDVEMVKVLAEHGANVDMQNDKGQTPLHIAAGLGDEPLLKYLCYCRANPNIMDKKDRTPLHIVAERGFTNLVEILTERFRSSVLARTKLIHSAAWDMSRFPSNNQEFVCLVSPCKDGSTLMHVASQSGHPDTALAFLKKGVPLYMPNKAKMYLTASPPQSGAVCLHAAARSGHAGVVKALLLKGAQVDTITKDGYTALHLAVQACKPLVVETLLGFGAQVQCKGGKVPRKTSPGPGLHRVKVSQSCTQTGSEMCFVFPCGKAKETPLHIAAQVKEGKNVAEMLLKSGADVNAEQENGETAVHIAARHGNLQTLKALIEEGGDVTWQSKAGENPLHIAARHCRAHIVREILTYLANERSYSEAQRCVCQENHAGETPLHLAAALKKEMAHSEGERIDIITALMEYDADAAAATKEVQRWSQAGETPLHYCARVGNSDVLQAILSNVEDNSLSLVVNKHAKNGRSPLLLAAEGGHTEVVKVLLQNHARVDIFDEQGKAALHLAAEHGYEEIADILLSNKAFVNAKTKLGMTPLHLGAQSGSTCLVMLLVNTHLASIDALTLKKQTPLHLAALYGELDVCSALLNMNADVNACDMVRGHLPSMLAEQNHGQSPLHLAAESNHSEVVKLFLNHRPELASLANVEGSTCAHIAASKGSVAVIRELLKFSKGGVMSAHSKAKGSSPLHLAAAGGHKEVVKILLEAGASTTEEDLDGMTAIHLAAKNGHTHLLEVLKGRISFKISSAKTGLTALHIAASFGQEDFAHELLTEVPATICSMPPIGSFRDSIIRHQLLSEAGYTPLHLAAQSGHEGLVRLLLNYPDVQADAQTDKEAGPPHPTPPRQLNGRCRSHASPLLPLHKQGQAVGSTPLHLAAQNGHIAVLGLLLSRSSSYLHLNDLKGRTCLHGAAARGHIATARMLLGQGAEVNHTDKVGATRAKTGALFPPPAQCCLTLACSHNGWTPLHYAANSGCLEMVRFLVESGASVLLECQHGRTPLQHAAEGNHHDTFIFDLMVCGKLNNNIVIQEFVLHSAAPLDTAVKLSRALDQAALREKERSVDLLDTARHCEAIATELLTVASESTSTDTILRAVDHRGATVLDCLIECQKKAVVAHPAVQEYLTEVWHGGLRWASWKIVLLFLGLLFCPPLWLILSLPFRHKFNAIPIIKFMNYLVSHIILLFLFILTIVYPPSNTNCLNHLLPNWSEWLLLLWLCGMLVTELTQPGLQAVLPCVRLLVLAFSGVAFICHLVAFGFQDTDRFHCLFARNIFLAMAMTLSFVQLLEFLTFHHLFGPWAIIIKDLMKDVVRFAVILVLFHTAFTMNLSAIYQPFHTAVNTTECHRGNGTNMRPLNISYNLFFALFGLTGLDFMPSLSHSSKFADIITHIVFGIYLVVTIIVLINLLIAMMSDTYQRIQAQSDTEWKFGRAVLIRDMNVKSGTPSPFNLFTSLFFFIKVHCKRGGKICSSQARDPMTEEDMEGLSDVSTLDIVARASTGWLRSSKRTGILPEGKSDKESRALKPYLEVEKGKKALAPRAPLGRQRVAEVPALRGRKREDGAHAARGPLPHARHTPL